ncbi:MAG: lipopolysaccharide biosynthesis protein [Bacteroidales bacterium]|jgi:O-antigen/teichoic acid export membrane protein|nr:lipopolysaccharide biosynthesis protein [Bacteroidales bacterium]
MADTEKLTLKTFDGAKWSLIGNVVAAVISFVVGIVLARILTIQQYGILGMIAVFIAVSNAFIDSGFSNALIRKKEVTVSDYNTLFYFNVGISVIAFIILFLLAGPIAKFYNMPLLVPVTRAVATTLIINAIGLVQIVVLTRDVDFKRQSIANIVSTFVGGVIAIFLAVKGYGVWSLVWQQIIKQFVNTLLLWVLCSWRPAFLFSTSGFSMKSCKDMFGFGSKLLASGILSMLFDNASYIVIGKFYSSKQLGLYTRGEQFTNFLSLNYTYAVQRATFPSLSMLQDDKPRLKGAFVRVYRSVMLISVSLCLFLAAMSKPLVLSLLGAKWAATIPYMQLLCFIAMFFPLHAINLNVLQVKGRSDWVLHLEYIKRAISIAPIVVGIFVSIKAMLVVKIFTSIISLYVNCWGENKLLGYSFWEEMRDFLPVLGIASAISAVILCVQFIPISCYAQLVIQAIGGCALFHFIYTWIKQPQYVELKGLALSYLKKNNKNEEVE